MTKILMRRTLAGKLEPVDEAGRDVLARVSSGSVLSVEVKRPRNVGHLRKFWALISLIYENQTKYRSPDELLEAIKLHIGHYVPHHIKGRTVYVPKSISFAAMDQMEFDKFWERVVSVVCQEIIPGLDREDLERELLDLVA